MGSEVYQWENSDLKMGLRSELAFGSGLAKCLIQGPEFQVSRIIAYSDERVDRCPSLYSATERHRCR